MHALLEPPRLLGNHNLTAKRISRSVGTTRWPGGSRRADSSALVGLLEFDGSELAFAGRTCGYGPAGSHSD